MMGLFKKRVSRVSRLAGLWDRVGTWVECRQRKAADYLNAKVVRCSNRQLRMGLLSFFLLFGGAAGWVIWQALYGPVKATRVQAIKVPEHALIPEPGRLTDLGLRSSEIRSIQAFRGYLDSLQQSPSGRLLYDSIAHHRPGLLDSLRLIEMMYAEQLKTSGNAK